MTFRFEWDREKARANLKKHGISFEESITVFDDPFAITLNDSLHSANEERLLTIGYSQIQRLLLVVNPERGDVIRIISARLATKPARKIRERSF
jgi:uncharacterized protein